VITTLRLFSLNHFPIETSTAWYPNDLGEFRGKQALYTQQSPQRLKALRESSIIESAVSSNRIEGVTIDPNRVRDILVAPRPLFRDRDEEEVRGYRDALALIHKDATELPIGNETICRLHALTRGQIWDAGKYKERDGDIIERVGEIKAPRGEKRESVIAGINQLLSRAKGEFKMSELEQVCPGVSRDMVRHVLREQQEQGFIGCSGRGAGAVWAKVNGGNQLPPNKGNEGGTSG
jgi:hypothetical protein